MSMPFATLYLEPHVQTRGLYAVEIYRPANERENRLLAIAYGVTRTQAEDHADVILKALQAM